MANTNNTSKTLYLAEPFINIFKKYEVNNWKKGNNIGKLSNYYDLQLKSTTHELSSSNHSHRNCIQLPKFGHQSLKLEGRYFYFNFLSNSEKEFSLDIDSKFLENGSMKISISTSFIHFKITSIGCQIPIIFKSRRGVWIDQSDDVWPSCIFVEGNIKWTILCIDLQVISDLLNCKHSHIKKLKISGDVLFSNMFVSDYLFVPKHLLQEVMTPLCYVLPDEMNFKLCDDSEWKETYAFVCFPQNVCTEPDCKHGRDEGNDFISDVSPKRSAGRLSPLHLNCDDDDDEEMTDDFIKSDPILELDQVLGFGGVNAEHAVMDQSATMVIYPCNALLVLQHVDSGVQKFMIGHTNKISCLSTDVDFQLLASAQAGMPGLVRLWSIERLECLAVVQAGAMSVSCLSISRSGLTLCCAGKDASLKNVIVIWDIRDVKGEGEFEVICKGHTEVHIAKMMMMMTMHNEERMISCGHGNIRLWRVKGGHLKSTPINLVDHHTESFVDVVFESEAGPSEFTEQTREFAYDVAYACTRTSLIFEIDCINITVSRIINFRNISPLKNPMTPNVMLVTQNYICLGESSGTLSMWTRDAMVGLYEIDLCSPIKVIGASNDCVKVLVGREDGGLGLLDLKTRQISPLQSSVGKKIINCSLDVRHLYMCTISSDGGVRLWSLFDLCQPIASLPSCKDVPNVSAFHPKYDLIFIGSTLGHVRVYETCDLNLVLEMFNLHNGSAITTLIFNEDGLRLYSSSANSGKLIMHRVDILFADDDGDDDDDSKRLKVVLSHMKTLQNALASKSITSLSPIAFSMSSDKSLLAYISPARTEVFVRDSLTLKEIVRIDMSKITKCCDWKNVSTCHQMTFSSSSNSCLIIQSGDGYIYNYDYTKDEVLNQLENTVESDDVGIISTFNGTDNVAIARDKIIKIFQDNSSSHFQMFIGHSEPIRQMHYEPMRSIFITIGDALFIWNFKGINIDDDETDGRDICEEYDFTKFKRHCVAIKHFN